MAPPRPPDDLHDRGGVHPRIARVRRTGVADGPHQTVLAGRAAGGHSGVDEGSHRRSQLMKREAWFELARDLDWDFSYVREEEVFPSEVSGRPWLPRAAWRGWDEPYKTTYADYVANQSE